MRQMPPYLIKPLRFLTLSRTQRRYDGAMGATVDSTDVTGLTSPPKTAKVGDKTMLTEIKKPWEDVERCGKRARWRGTNFNLVGCRAVLRPPPVDRKDESANERLVWSYKHLARRNEIVRSHCRK